MELGFIHSIFFGEDTLMRILHIVGFIIAVGGVASIDFLLLVFHFKPELGKSLAKVFPIFSGQISLGFILLSLTGIPLILSRPWLSENFYFQLKFFFVLAVFLNGIFITYYAGPRFAKLAPKWTERTAEIKRYEMISAVSGVISVTGWWGAVIVSLLVVHGVV
ncbi:hypothetical protein MWH28_02075 [Natroniella sulfidigena]|uniref:hypothetical protein n=1 Tax=Natroniella sulfidigena TaxID=723921 RepID=UPI00200A132D|nr:hypothetical protein [Natroniella sulfidigena]MCK8816151.1 hypothetical protein [Natroniella sulfidigena]